MREFYEACDAACESDHRAIAIRRLREAHDIMQPIIEQAKSRLELRLVADLVEYLRWTTSWVIYKIDESKGEWPGFGPLSLMAWGTTFVYPPTPKKEGGSLRYRWGAWRELPETMLPNVAMRTGWPSDRLCEETIEFAT
jgi:hypothetical protein